MATDPRFAKVAYDPRFKRPKASQRKVVVDERFKSIFEGDQDYSKSERKNKVDKYGRKVGKGKEQDDLKKYYRLQDDKQDEAGPSGLDLARGEVLLESSSEEEEEDESSASDSDSDEGSVTLGPAHAARQRSRSLSIDLDEDAPVQFADQQDDNDEEAESTNRLAIVNMDWDNLRAIDLYRALASALSKSAPVNPEPVKQLILDDPDKIKPSSRLSIAKGRLRAVTIYPSEFGRERLAREAIEGPPVEAFQSKKRKRKDGEDESGDEVVLGRGAQKAKSKRAAEESDDDEDITEQDVLQEQVGDAEDYDHDALRKYQLERLRYYYAIAEFDSARAARHVYDQINGTEFERTANIFDLQFVPDDVSFEQDPIHEQVTESKAKAEADSYEPLNFTTDALQHSKVKLTWDADDPFRKGKITKYMTALHDMNDKKKRKAGKVAKVDEADIAAYLASSSSEEEAGESADEVEQADHDDFFEKDDVSDRKSKKSKERERLRKLFGLEELEKRTWDGGAKADKAEGEMEITFAPALSKPLADDDDDDQGERQETALERYKRKEKERKARKKAERQARREGKTVEEVEALAAANGDDQGFNDDFFEQDVDMSAAFEAHDDGRDDDDGSKKKVSKKDKRDAKKAAASQDAQERAELDLLIGSDDEDTNRHFDMKAILKAEKLKGKKQKKLKGKKAQEVEEIQDDFSVDVADPRFKNVHEDYNYAIDPSHPRFQKTRNMDALLSEGRKRRSTKHDTRDPVRAAGQDQSAASSLDSLDALVQSVKRKAAQSNGASQGRGKRAKA